jgi:hypothetical protein
MSRSSAVSHSAPCTQPSVKAAVTSSPVPSAVLHASPIVEDRSPGSSRLATMKSRMCATRTAA